MGLCNDEQICIHLKNSTYVYVRCVTCFGKCSVCVWMGGSSAAVFRLNFCKKSITFENVLVLKFIVAWRNLHNVKFTTVTIFSVQTSGALNTLTMLCTHPHCPFGTFASSPNSLSVPIKYQAPALPSPYIWKKNPTNRPDLKSLGPLLMLSPCWDTLQSLRQGPPKDWR